MNAPGRLGRGSRFESWNPDDQEYKCCCGCIHVQTACILVGIAELIGLLGALADGIVSAVQSKDFGLLAGPVAGIVIGLIIVILLMVGACMNNRYLLIPHMIVQIITICLLFILAIITLVTGVVQTAKAREIFHKIVGFKWSSPDANEGVEKTEEIAIAVVICIVYLIAWLIDIWFYTLVLQCYRYTRDLRYYYGGGFRYQEDNGSIVPPSVVGSGYYPPPYAIRPPPIPHSYHGDERIHMKNRFRQEDPFKNYPPAKNYTRGQYIQNQRVYPKQQNPYYSQSVYSAPSERFGRDNMPVGYPNSVLQLGFPTVPFGGPYHESGF